MGQRPNRPKTKVVSDTKEYFALLTSAGLQTQISSTMKSLKCFIR